MAVAERKAEVVWEGDVNRGGGTIRLATSGAGGELQISLRARAGEADGQTSPEELIGAAHAGCYAMALSNVLTQAGAPPERLDTSASVALDCVDSGYAITSVELTVRGRVPGIEAGDFEEAARQADQACPVSSALRGNVDIRLAAQLER